MTTDDTMTIDEVYKYLRKMRSAYAEADQTKKGRMLDDMERVTGRHRKSLIRLLRGPLERCPRRQQRRRTYQADFDAALRRIYESYGCICAERLHPNLTALAAQLAKHDEVDLTPSLQAQLATVGLTTVRERLQRFRQDEPQLRRGAPRPPNPFLHDTPMQRLSWDIQTPGYFEVDLVHHCGSSSHGEYVHTLQLVDVASGWSERVALLGRSYRVVEDGFRRILVRLPFPIRGLHPDNGSEFFNHHMARFWAAYPQIEISRSRPYHKNDNRFVEHRNGALIRGWIGHDRLDSAEQARALNAFYEKLRIYHNLFQPVMRLTHKTYDRETQRVRRHWDRPRTPFQRLLASGTLSAAVADQLQRLYDQTDPLTLRQELQEDVRALFALPGAQADRSEDVFATLLPDHPLYTTTRRKEEVLLSGDVIK